jgi:uncharacterized protein
MLSTILYILICFIIGAMTWALHWGPQAQVLVLLMGLSVFLLQKFVHRVPIEELGFRLCTVRQLAMGVGIPLAILVFVALVDLLSGAAQLRPLSSLHNPFAGAPVKGMWDLSLFLAINGAILFLLEFVTEELMFRGYILGKLVTLGEFKGLVITSALFGLWHVPIALWGTGPDPIRTPVYLVNMALLGTILGLIFLESRSLIPVAAFHAIWNTLEYNFFGFMDQQALLVGTNRILFDAEEGIIGMAALAIVTSLVLLMRYRSKIKGGHQMEEETAALEV